MIIPIFIVFLGIVLGSFVNAFVWRIRNKKDWVNGRSECTHCHHELAPKDLVPIFSYLFLKGKCRYCHRKIDDTPIVEIALPILFIVSYIWWPFGLTNGGLFQFVFWLIFLVGFLALADFDIRWMLLPDKIVFPLTVLAIVEYLCLAVIFNYSWHFLISAALGALILGGSFYILFQLSSGRWIGGGDVKLAPLLGILAGSPMQALLVVFIASIFGTIYSVPLLMKVDTTSKKLIPFGPFLILGIFIVKIFGSRIINYYLHIVI